MSSKNKPKKFARFHMGYSGVIFICTNEIAVAKILSNCYFIWVALFMQSPG